LQAEEGIMLLKDYVDTLLVISNDKLRHQFGNLKMKEAFSKADNVLATAAKCITDVINSTGQINVDFADVCTVMRNGGVAILGSSAASGNNRAQQAIEEALNSPLLNDNDIRGAKWILININSSEGEHEFTMDEVEIIQQHLIGQAGPDTDVILGLGYDNNLKDKIGITIIATGFEYKDPFPREQKPAVKKEEEKIVIPLQMPSAETVMVKEKPMVEVQEKTKTIFSINALAPELQPKLVETRPAEKAKSMGTVVLFPSQPVNRMPMENQVEKNIRQEPIEWILSQETIPTLPQLPAENQPVNDPVVAVSGGYLSRPSNIYAEEQTPENGFLSEPVPVNDEKNLSPVASHPVPEEKLSADMQLVFKDDIPAADAPRAHPTQPESLAEQPAEEPALQDKAEGLKRRAAERINKLRNLSFNMNAADPNNEFETVPAYIRRNLELYNTVNNVETFYSQYEVRADKNNLGEISTINSFLDGKKPD
jgi:cell division protein FtsZ